MSERARGAIPLAGWADRQLAVIAALAGAQPAGGLRALSGAGLLGERATLNGLAVPGDRSAGGGCRLLAANHGHVALNLARAEDRELLPALFSDAGLDPADDHAIAARMACCDPDTIVARGRELGLALASLAEHPASPALFLMTPGLPRNGRTARPLVIDLSALWAGPLAGNLLTLVRAEVVKVESRRRPDAMRDGDPLLFERLNGGKASLALDLHDGTDRDILLQLLAQADIVIEAARPRALAQLGIDANALVRTIPGLVWLTITGHGVIGDAADWVGFGDDCGVAGGLSDALWRATGEIGFVGDAIADPLTGLAAARAALEQRAKGVGARLALAMSAIARQALVEEDRRDPLALDGSLRAWAASRRQPFAPVASRPSAPLRRLGADNAAWRERLNAC